MKKLFILAFLLLFSFCSSEESSSSPEEVVSAEQAVETVPDTESATTESATTESATTDSATTESESSSLPAHMTIIYEPAKIYFASDLSSNVQENFKYGVALAQERFGNYPTQIMVVGTDRDAMLDLANTYCTLKEEADQLWYFKDKDECIMVKTREDGHDFPHYLRVGLETIEKNYPNSGAKGHNG